MHRLAYLAATCLTGLTITTPAQAAVPDPVAIAAAMYPASPCNGKITVAFSDQLDPTRDAEAAINDLSRFSLNCVVTFRTAAYNQMTRHQRCATFVHEAGHLAGLQHGPGIMGAHAPHEYFAPCASVRERAQHYLASKPGVFSTTCGKQTGNVMICRTERAGVQGRGARRYRVRINGEQFTLRRIR